MSDLPSPCAPAPDEIIRRLYVLRRRSIARLRRVEIGATAAQSLAEARSEYARDPAKAWNRVRYESEAIWSRGVLNGAKDEDGCRWIEAPALVGLRFVGLYHDVDKSARHNGWWLDPDGMGETVSGVVYQLPARKGRTRFLAGMNDPFNDGSARLDMGMIEADDWRAINAARLRRNPKAKSYDLSSQDVEDESARLEAARRGDRIAERYAEQEREYLEVYAAGAAAREKAREALEAGKAWVKLLRAARNTFATRRARSVVGITLAETLAAFRHDKEALRAARERYEDARDEARAARDDIGAYAWRNYKDAVREGYDNG